MYLNDVENAPAFATLQFPATNADKFQEVNISQPVNIDNLDAFTQFNVAFFQSKNLTVRIAGKTQIQPSGLSRKYDVDFTKVLTIAGLNLLEGTTVSNGQVNLTALTGPNFNGIAEITNPSHFTLDIVSSAGTSPPSCPRRATANRRATGQRHICQLCE